MVKIKSPTYTPIGEELSGNAALLQAASALDAAVYFAVESKDVKKLMEATAIWLNIASQLGVVLSPDDDEEEEQPKKPTFGFNGPKKEDTSEGSNECE